ncbi:hypothetical protein D3C78_1157240 [compost metagenome]
MYTAVKVFVRKKLPVSHPKLEQIIVDFDQLEPHSQHFLVDDLYCCLGTTIKKAGSQAAFRRVDYDYPLKLAILAKQNGVRQFLLITAMGSNAKSSIFYSRVKGELEEAIKQLQLPAFHIFQPSLLLGKREEFRLGESIAAAISPLLSSILIGRLRKYKPVQAREVALAMYAAASTQTEGITIYESDRIIEISKQLELAG